MSVFQISDFPVGFTKEFESRLKEEIENCFSFVFVASDFYDHERTMNFVRLVNSKFEEIGIDFDSISLIDAELSAGQMKEFIENADVIWLSGGDTLRQNQSLRENGIKAMLKKSRAVIIGQSAGAMNLATTVLFTEENRNEVKEAEGLGLVDTTIIPHYLPDRESFVATIFEESEITELVCLFDEAFIEFKNQKREIVGEVKIFKK